ncbi:MAG TPA: dockerin type I domain-containing protein [Candidatus Limnocylindrales bacterium]|nr:dockerin type I domain-containing protein [Candidatus Limnocylindrales bacterium]
MAPSHREYDVAFYFGPDPLASTRGDCTIFTVPPDLSSFDGDQCGDIDKNVELQVPVTNLSAGCVDADGDGFFEVNLCTSWDNTSTDVCSGTSNAFPSANSRCNCSINPTADIKVKITSAGLTSGDEFARAVSATPGEPDADDFTGDHGYLVVGAPALKNAGTGKVHILNRDLRLGYVEVLAIVDPDASGPSTGFGSAVDADGETIVVGAPLDHSSSHDGSASVYVRDNGVWSFQAKLVDTSGDCTLFGTDVAISGDTIVVGAPGGDCAVVYQRSSSTWMQTAKLIAPTGGTRFGQAVDVSGLSILVGAPGAVAGTSGCAAGGAVYAYRQDGAPWQLDSIVTDPSGTGSCFGIAVAIDGTTAAIGAPRDDSGAPGGGSVSIIERGADDWTITGQVLASPDPSAVLGFGTSLDMRGDSLLVGAPGYKAHLFERGSAAAPLRTLSKYVFTSDYPPPTSDDPGDTDDYGISVTLARDKTIFGMPSANSDSGAVIPGAAPEPAVNVCGDGNLLGSEECDDGNTVSGDHCDASCRIESCGNGRVEGLEQCDVAQPCCSAACTLLAASSPCRAAAGVCDAVEKCTGSSAACPADGFKSAQAGCTNDSNVCTNDHCDGAGACIHANNTSACDDGDACTSNDVCAAGLCTGTAIPGCGETTTTTSTTTSSSTTTITLPDPQCGDANGDASVTASDALQILKSAVGVGSCPLNRCDVNADHKISAIDALLVLKTAVGAQVDMHCA